ncbi:MAG: AAA family ATPase [bacterium]|nr:AAA family ATPase [bacterium]
MAKEALRNLRGRRNVILYGPPGTGKTRAALQAMTLWKTEEGADSVFLTTFHPSYSYEDFVEGWRPDTSNQSGFQLVPGVLLEAIEAANSDDSRNVLIVVDEINRGDVARIFGEFITFVEHDKRNVEFITAQNRDQLRTVPKNLFLLGTMNTADKSINLLDTALRRRFTFLQCAPDPGVFESSPELLAEVEGVQLSALLVAINRRLAAQNIEPDRQIGHAMLGISMDSSDPEQELRDRLCYDILPLVSDYLYDDPERIRQVMPGFLDDDDSPMSPDQAIDIEAVLAEPEPIPEEGFEADP